MAQYKRDDIARACYAGDVMRQVIFNKGQTLYRAGEAADRIFVLLNGEVGLFSPLNPDVTHLRLEDYGTFGETEVINGHLRRFTARCLADCEVLEMAKQEFQARLESTDPLIKLLVKSLTQHSVMMTPVQAQQRPNAA